MGKIAKTKQMKIAKYYLDNKSTTSYDKVGIKFNVTKDQVRNYVRNYENNRYSEIRSLRENEEVDKERIRVRQELKESSISALLDETIIDVIAEIRSRKDFSTTDRMNAINKLTLAMKRTQELQFVEALRKPDAKKVILLMQSENPNLTENEIIQRWMKITLEN